MLLCEITVTTETKNENVSHDHFSVSQSIRFSDNVIICISSYLLNIDYTIVLYIFVVFCWVSVSLLTDPAHMHSH